MTQEAFKAWWYNEGSQAPYTHHDCEEHTMRMCEIAWNAAVRAEQEPVAHCKVRPLRGDESFPKVEIDWVNQPVPGPLYTFPPQRAWVGLTDDELLEIYGWRKAPMLSDFIVEEAKQELLGALRKVEAKLKEKNT